MKHVNAEKIMPDSLVKEIRKYIQSGYVYIPPQPQKRTKWGENTGSREYFKNRNKAIRNYYRGGSTIENLSEEFSLSIDSIKKIIYTKNT